MPVVLAEFDVRFINALDFESPKDLVDYLLPLDQNEVLYDSYFEWKRHYNVGVPSMRAGVTCAENLTMRTSPLKFNLILKSGG